jgi:hypothetical protein
MQEQRGVRWRAVRRLVLVMDRSELDVAATLAMGAEASVGRHTEAGADDTAAWGLTEDRRPTKGRKAGVHRRSGLRCQ